MQTSEQSVLVIQPPYGTCLMQQLHHVELLYAKTDITKVINWINELQKNLVTQYVRYCSEKLEKCTDCNDGYILDRDRRTEVFPDGIPIKCSTCNGIGYVTVNDIIPNTERSIPIHVVPDNGELPPLVPNLEES